MSWWGTIHAEFKGGSITPDFYLLAEVPKGSESGPDTTEYKGAVTIEGRLRDVTDFADSPAVLAWFVTVCDRAYPDEAELLWELDSGPRYRYRYTPSGGLEKLRGILDG